MARYLLSVYQPDGPAPEPDVLGPIMEAVAAVDEELRQAGAWVFTAGLHPAGTATVVRNHDGEALLTDGPFTEGKEHLGGFSIIDVPDLDAALHWARKFTLAHTLPIEVRPIQG